MSAVHATTRLGCVLSQRQTAGESAGWRWDRSICAVLCLDTQCVEHHKHEERGINEGLLSGNHTRAVFVMLLERVMLRSCLRRGTSHACSACSTRLECTCSDTTPAQRHWRRKSPHIVRRRSRHCARWARSKRRSPEQAAAARSSGVVWPPSVPVYSTPRVHGITRLKWAERMSTAGVGAAQAPESIGHAVLARDTPHVSQERVGRGGCAWCGGM